MPPLLDIQVEQFCQEYLVDLCGAAAARRAKFSVTRARMTACELLKRDAVRERINELIREREETSPVRKYRVLEELAAVACSSVEHFNISDAGKVVIAKGAPNRAMAAIKRIKRKTRTIPQGKDAHGNPLPPIVQHEVEFTLHDKNPAMAKYLEHVGLIKPAGINVAVSVGVTAVVELTPAERAARLQEFGIPVDASRFTSPPMPAPSSN